MRASVNLTKTELKATVREAVLDALKEWNLAAPVNAEGKTYEMTAPPPTFELPALPYLRNVSTTKTSL